MTQVLQRLPRQLLRGGWISGLLEETRLRLLKKGLYGSSELRISEVAGKSGRASRHGRFMARDLAALVRCSLPAG